MTRRPRRSASVQGGRFASPLLEQLAAFLLSEGAAGAGQIRILGALSGTAGTLLLLFLYIWTRPGRRPQEGGDSEADSPAADSEEEKADA